MLSFLGRRKDSKKSPAEREAMDLSLLGLQNRKGQTSARSVKMQDCRVSLVVKAGERDGLNVLTLRETAEEQRNKLKPINTAKPSTNVIVQPSKSSSAGQSSSTETIQPAPVAPSSRCDAEPQGVEAAPALSELLGDIPFTLAPHILAMQAGVPLVPEFVLPRDINANLDSFCYDFTLENSVLCEP